VSPFAILKIPPLYVIFCTDLGLKEDAINKGAVSGYAGLDASQELLLANFPSGIGLQVLRRNAANTALEFADESGGGGITSINADITAAQIIAAGTGLGIVDAGATHTISIDATVATLSGTQTLFNKTIGHLDFTNHIHADVVHVEVRNESGGTVNSGDAVVISGYSIGQDLPLIILADSSSLSTVPVIGIVASPSIANNTNGSVYISGRLANIDTSSFTAGDILYISNVGTTGNTLTNVKPTGTDLIEIVGEVLRSHASLGVLEIDLTHVEDLPNVATHDLSMGGFSLTSVVIVTPTIASFVNATHDHESAAGGGTLLSTAALSDTANIAYLNTANVWTTGLQDFSAVTLRIPVSATPSVTIDGDIAYDNTVADFTTGLIRFFGTEEQGIVAMPIAQFTTPSDGFVVAYNATNDEFELVAQSGGGSQTPWLSNIDAATFNLSALGILSFIDTNTSITQSGVNLLYDVAVSGSHAIRVDDNPEYNFNATRADFSGNDLIGVGTLQFSNSDVTIDQVGSDLEYDVSGSGNHDFRIGDTLKYQMTVLAFKISTGLSLQFENNQLLNGDLGGINYNVPTGDNHDFRVNNTVEYRFNATEADFNGNDLINAPHDHENAAGGGQLDSTLALSDTGNIAYLNTANLFAATQTFPTDTLRIQNPATTQTYSVKGSAITDSRDVTLPLLTANDIFVFEAFAQTLSNKTITNTIFIDFGAGSAETGSIRLPNSATIEWEASPAGTNGTITLDASGFAINPDGGNDFDIRGTSVNPNRILTMGNNEIQFASSTQSIENISNNLTYDVPTGQSHDFRVNDVVEYSFSGTQADFQGNTLTGITVLQVGSGSFPTNGQIRLPNNNTIAWRNGADDSNHNLGFNGADIFEITINGANEYQFSDTQADWNGNNLVNVGDLIVGDRFQGNKGADIVGAATITLGDGNYFDITGNTSIDFMTTTGWQAGSVVVLQFDANGGANDNTSTPPANTVPFALAGVFNSSAGDTLTVVFDGAFWREISRSVN